MITGLSSAMRSTLADSLQTTLLASTGAYVALYQNNITPSPLSLLADFTKADFTGYADALAYSSSYKVMDSPSGSWRIVGSAPCNFTAGAVTSPQTVYGYYVMNHAKSSLLGYGIFEEPYTFQANGDELVFLAYLAIPVNAGSDAG